MKSYISSADFFHLKPILDNLPKVRPEQVELSRSNRAVSSNSAQTTHQIAKNLAMQE